MNQLQIIEIKKHFDKYPAVGTKFHNLKYLGIYYDRNLDLNYFKFSICCKDTEFQQIYVEASLNKYLLERLIETKKQLSKTSSWKRKNDLSKYIYRLEKEIIEHGKFY